MAIKGRSKSERFSRWQVLVNNAKQSPARRRRGSAKRLAQLDELLARVRTLENRQAQLRSESQAITKEIAELGRQGDRIRSRMGAYLEALFGFTSNELVRYGFRPRKLPPRRRTMSCRRRRRKRRNTRERFSLDTGRELALVVFIASVAAVYVLAGGVVVRRLLRGAGRARPAQVYAERVVLGLAVGGLLCIAYGYFIEPRWLQVRRVQLRTDKLRPGATLRIVQISDLHSEREPLLESRLPEIVAEQEPDLIVFTGTRSIPRKDCQFSGRVSPGWHRSRRRSSSRGIGTRGTGTPAALRWHRSSRVGRRSPHSACSRLGRVGGGGRRGE